MFSSLLATGITTQGFLYCTAISLVLGLLISIVFSFRAEFSPGFRLTVAIIPAVVQIIIMMVTGSIGAGVAVAGTFSLIRFRSEAGTARQLCAIFLAVAVGIAMGRGFAVIAVCFFVIVALFYVLLSLTAFGKVSTTKRTLRISIPESLDYDGVFDDLFATYTKSHTLDRVRTTNMGTLFELTYTITLTDEKKIKAFMDDIRARNGNLTVVCGRINAESDL